jgi:hypothetical protein
MLHRRPRPNTHSCILALAWGAAKYQFLQSMGGRSQRRPPSARGDRRGFLFPEVDSDHLWSETGENKASAVTRILIIFGALVEIHVR